MKKIIDGMGEIEFGRFYNKKNKIISSLKETPIIDSEKIETVSLKQAEKLLDNEYIFNLVQHRDEINIYKTNPKNRMVE